MPNELFDRIAAEALYNKDVQNYFGDQVEMYKPGLISDDTAAIAAIVAILERELTGAKITFCPPAIIKR
jgi:hypothetical protein